jgi:hypothetical protein
MVRQDATAGLEVRSRQGGPRRRTYGDYLLAKVAKVFPGLGSDVLDP